MKSACMGNGLTAEQLEEARLEAELEDWLRAEKQRAEEPEEPALPDPANMTQDQRADELYALGWERAWVGPVERPYKRPAWVLAARPGHGPWPETDESWGAYTIRALLGARELKAQEGKP